MIGLAVLAGVAIYIAIWWFLVAALKPAWAKALAILVALAIPFWDLPIGYYNFERHCSIEGGLQILSKFPPTDSILLDRRTGYRPENLVRYGFRVVEYKANDGTVERFTLTGDKFDKTSHGTPVSTIALVFVGHRVLPWHLVQSELVARRIGDGQVVARHNTFVWLGTWWQAESAPLLGYGARCGEADAPLALTIARGSDS